VFVAILSEQYIGAILLYLPFLREYIEKELSAVIRVHKLANNVGHCYYCVGWSGSPHQQKKKIRQNILVHFIQLAHSCRGPEKKCFIYIFSNSTRQWYFYYNNMKIRDICLCAYIYTHAKKKCAIQIGGDVLSMEKISARDSNKYKKKKREKYIYKYIFMYMRVFQTVLLPCAREHGERVFGRRSSVCTLYILFLTRVVVYTFRIRHTFLPNGMGYIRERSYVYTYTYISDKVRATGKRNFSEIQKSNPRRRDNSIRKKKGEAKNPGKQIECRLHIYVCDCPKRRYYRTNSKAWERGEWRGLGGLAKFNLLQLYRFVICVKKKNKNVYYTLSILCVSVYAKIYYYYS